VVVAHGTAQEDAKSVSLVNCLLSMGANPKARGSPGSAPPEVLAGLKGNTAIIDALSAAAASGVTPAMVTSSATLKKTAEHEEVVPDAGKKRKAPSPPDDADDDEEAGGGDGGATSVKRRRTEGNEVRWMAELIREWVAERWSQVTAHDWIPHHFTTFYLRAQLHQCGLQPRVHTLPPPQPPNQPPPIHRMPIPHAYIAPPHSHTLTRTARGMRGWS
jgi:hypothetical protein